MAEYKVGGHTYSPEQILEINRIFHDFQCHVYDNMQEHMHREEAAYWQGLARRALGLAGRDGPMAVMDYGCGTGMVAGVWSGVLGVADRLICMDISEGMLDRARQRLEGAPAKVEFICGEAFSQRPDGQLDIVVLNSVLHHLPRPVEHLKQLASFLRPGGLLVVAHEPNRKWLDNPAMRAANQLKGKASQLVHGLRRRLSASHAAQSQGGEGGKGFTADVAAAINEANVVPWEVKKEEVTKLANIHAPDDGKGDGLAFDVEALSRELTAELTLVETETKAPLGGYGYKNPLLKTVERALCTAYPDDGSLFMVIWRKSSQQSTVDSRP